MQEEELVDGEIDPTRLNSINFDKTEESAPSVLRGAFAEPEDALHSDCAGQKDVTGQLVYYIYVKDLPAEIRSDDKKRYEPFPLHLPLVQCGAHSVISCCRFGDGSKTYAKPSRTARNDLRVKLAAKMQKERFGAETTPLPGIATDPD